MRALSRRRSKPCPTIPVMSNSKWQKYWEDNQTFRVEMDRRKRNFTSSTCSPIPPAPACTSAIPKATPRPTSSAATSGCAASTSCTRWAGTPSACPPSSTPIQTGTHPRITTQKNIDTFRRQIKSLGFSYDWDREVDTTDPDYFRWTQWIFLQLYERGPGLPAEVPVNWCPALGTVLANEEVHRRQVRETRRPSGRAAGRCGNGCCGSPPMPSGCSTIWSRLDWPEAIKEMQRNWIGRAKGAEVDFAIAGSGDELHRLHHAARHALRRHLHGARARASAGRQDHHARAAGSGATSTRKGRAQERSGAHRAGRRRRPASSPAPMRSIRSTARQIPIWIADYVLATLRHRRDHGRARPRRARLRVRQASSTCRSFRSLRRRRASRFKKAAYDGRRRSIINSGFLDGLDGDAAKSRR